MATLGIIIVSLSIHCQQWSTQHHALTLPFTFTRGHDRHEMGQTYSVELLQCLAAGLIGCAESKAKPFVNMI